MMTDLSSINQQGAASEMMMKRQFEAAQSKVNQAATSGNKSQMEISARKSAEEFEAMFLTQMLQPMFENIEVNGGMGGGHAEKMFRTMMVDEMGKGMARSGGIGLSDSIYKEILKMQEAG